MYVHAVKTKFSRNLGIYVSSKGVMWLENLESCLLSSSLKESKLFDFTIIISSSFDPEQPTPK